MPKWLKNTVFYEIYPQSFCDSNGDGIGDIRGIISKLDYIKDLGANAIWLNPIYLSPFMDAGYDVTDHKKIAPRYGTLDDVKDLLNEVHKRDMKILFDLVAGHTSDTHEWFLESKKAKKNEYSNRYIFTHSVWEAPQEYKFVCGITPRDGNYLVNFFSSQPALNYGFYDITCPKWQLPFDHPDCQKTVDALIDVMRYWLDLGVDGFRVDMADSLVKNDDEKIATAKIWQRVRKMLDKDYPEAALVSEWCNPQRSINNSGFHMDFYLDHYGNGYSRLFRYEQYGKNDSFFCDSANGDVTAFVDEYLPRYKETKDNGYICFMTNNHDMPRAPFYMSDDIIKLSHAFIMTMPGVPFIYYGDEIGMRYLDVLSKEGGYSRTGARTPMQWDDSKNKGFSTADENMLYLPVDKSEDAPSVENQKGNDGSIYENMKALVRLRKQYKELANDSDFEVVYAEKNKYPFAYSRGEFTAFVNPSNEEKEVKFNAKGKEKIYSIGEYSLSDEVVTIGKKSFLLIK